MTLGVYCVCNCMSDCPFYKNRDSKSHPISRMRIFMQKGATYNRGSTGGGGKINTMVALCSEMFENN